MVSFFSINWQCLFPYLLAIKEENQRLHCMRCFPFSGTARSDKMWWKQIQLLCWKAFSIVGLNLSVTGSLLIFVCVNWETEI